MKAARFRVRSVLTGARTIVRITTQVTLLESAQMKAFSKNTFAILMLGVVVSSAVGLNGRATTVQSLSVTSENPFQLRIQTRVPVTPHVQMSASPERLVIDLPSTVPGPGLRKISINRADVRDVRVNLFSANPPVTRIVVDLNSPQWYRVSPYSSGLIVSLGSDAQSAANPAPTIGWVSSKSTSAARASFRPFIVSRIAAKGPRPAVPVNGVTVKFDKGQLAIHAENATLSEVLFQIQKVTGAEIAIPSGTEQQRVAADFGPATPSEVLAELLNGSGLNFVVVGSPSDPTVLRSVILSQNSGAPPDPPASFAQPTTPPVAQNGDLIIENDPPPPQNSVPPPVPDSVPPPIPPPTM